MANNSEVIIHTMKDDLQQLKAGEKQPSSVGVVEQKTLSKKEILRLVEEAREERKRVGQVRPQVSSPTVKMTLKAKVLAKEEAEEKRKEEARQQALVIAKKKAVETAAQEEAKRKAREETLKKVREQQFNRAIEEARALEIKEEEERKEASAQERRRKTARWKAVLAQIQIRVRDIILKESAKKERQREIKQRKWQEIFEKAHLRAQEIIIREKEAIKEKLEKAKQLLETKIRALSINIAHIPVEQEPILGQKQKLEDIKKQLDQENEKIRECLETVRQEREVIETKEGSAPDAETRRKFEKKRWQIATKQRGLEKELWQQEEEISKTILAVNKVNQKYEDLEDQKRALENKRDEVLSQKKILELRQEKLSIKQRLSKIKQLKAEPSLKIQRLKIGKSELAKKLSRIIGQEQSIEEKEEKLEQTAEGKKETVEARWKVEKERENIEQKRWETEEAIKASGKTLSKIEPGYQGLLEEEKHLFERDHELDILLKFGPEAGQKKLEEEKQALIKGKDSVVEKILAEPEQKETSPLPETAPPEKAKEKKLPPVKKPKTAEEIKRENLIKEVKENIQIIQKESLKIEDLEERASYLQKMKKMIADTYSELNSQSIGVYWQEIE